MSREVYKNAPLALVACEVRYPLADCLDDDLRRLKAVLRDLLPIAKSETVQQIELVGGAQPDIKVSKVTRLLTRDRTSSVTVWPDKVIMETTKYPGYDMFRELIDRVVAGVVGTIAPAGVERIGLRYIDEIRPPDEPAGREWSNWVAPELIGPAAIPVTGATADDLRCHTQPSPHQSVCLPARLICLCHK